MLQKFARFYLFTLEMATPSPTSSNLFEGCMCLLAHTPTDNYVLGWRLVALTHPFIVPPPRSQVDWLGPIPATFTRNL